MTVVMLTVSSVLLVRQPLLKLLLLRRSLPLLRIPYEPVRVCLLEWTLDYDTMNEGSVQQMNATVTTGCFVSFPSSDPILSFDKVSVAPWPLSEEHTPRMYYASFSNSCVCKRIVILGVTTSRPRARRR